MNHGATSDRTRELGDFIRAMRERLKPADVGLPSGARRRTPGLRREEAAQLSGLSVTWYTWLEQGRDMTPSPAALARLAGALRLAPAERRYLFKLAGRLDADAAADGEADLLPPGLADCVAAIAAPAYILDRTWTARAWNKPAERLFVGWLDDEADRNLLRFIFLSPSAPTLICDHMNRARRVVAEFRADASANDPALRQLVDGLAAGSPVFGQFWGEHSVLGREGGERTFEHPLDGFLRFEQVTFALSGGPDFKLTMLVPR
jgi:transcriptional regulator with XRE-family HTH domain